MAITVCNGFTAFTLRYRGEKESVGWLDRFLPKDGYEVFVKGVSCYLVQESPTEVLLLAASAPVNFWLGLV
jgi:hypothetical protein